jgi:dienelactone hydrolase
MPLAIGVYEDAQGHVHVSRLNVGLVGMMFGGTIADVMGTAGADLAEVVASVTTD